MASESAEECLSFRRQVEALLDSELPAEQAQILGDHARKCPQCECAKEAEVHLRAVVRQCLQENIPCPPPDLREKIRASIHWETTLRLRRCRG